MFPVNFPILPLSSPKSINFLYGSDYPHLLSQFFFNQANHTTSLLNTTDPKCSLSTSLHRCCMTFRVLQHFVYCLGTHCLQPLFRVSYISSLLSISVYSLQTLAEYCLDNSLFSHPCNIIHSLSFIFGAQRGLCSCSSAIIAD